MKPHADLLKSHTLSTPTFVAGLGSLLPASLGHGLFDIHGPWGVVAELLGFGYLLLVSAALVVNGETAAPRSKKWTRAGVALLVPLVGPLIVLRDAWKERQREDGHSV